MVENLTNEGIYSLFGPDHDINTATYCLETQIAFDCEGWIGEGICPLEIDNPTCEYLKSFDCDVDECTEIGVKYLDHLVQQSWNGQFTEYSATYNDDGWYTAGTLYDLSSVITEIQAWYVYNDMQADENVNKAIIEPLTYKAIWWNEGQTP